MRIYTKTGDTGQTSLASGVRVRKDHLRVATYGEVDELNALLGVAAALPSELTGLLTELQAELFRLGTELADPREPKEPLAALRLGEAEIARLETLIDTFEARLPRLESFILPGGGRLGAALHHARTVCRRAERSVVSLGEHEPLSQHLLVYLNRLSDLLFVLARSANHTEGQPEVRWSRKQPQPRV